MSRILVFDIETAPMTAYVWGRRDVNIALNQIKKDWFVLAFAAKWLGDAPSKTVYFDQSKEKNIENDKKLLGRIWSLLDQADIVITHNGRRFDSRKLNARFILNGMNPPSPYKHFDTLALVRTVADFTSNSLEYLTTKLCVKYKKLNHGKYPGMELWNACLAGDKHVWKEMKKYNIYDVLSLEEFYYKIRAWAPVSAPDMHPIAPVALMCKTCGAIGRMQARGYEIRKTGRYQRYHCQHCGRWTTGPKLK